MSSYNRGPARPRRGLDALRKALYSKPQNGRALFHAMNIRYSAA
jgi:hypothetical protein